MNFKEVNFTSINLKKENTGISKKEEYINTLNEYIQELSACSKFLSKAIEYINFNRIEESYIECTKLSHKLEKLCMKVRIIPNKYGSQAPYDVLVNKSELEDLDLDSAIEENRLQFYYNNRTIKVVLPSLLPRKEKHDYANKKTRYFSNPDLDRIVYYNSFRKEYEEDNLIPYTERVVLCFTHYFNDDKNIVDAENLNSKIITDVIALFLLKDDSLKYCSVFHTYEIGEHVHTEIEIIPYSKFFTEKKPSP